MKEKREFSILKNKKALFLCAALFALGLVLVLLSGGKEEEGQEAAKSAFDENAYVAALEARLNEHLSAINGAGQIRVMLTLDTTGAQNYVRDLVSENTESESAESGRDTQTLVLQSGKNGVKSPVLESESLPRIRGVCVIASGAGDPQVRLKITEALEALLGIRANQVSVIA